MDTDKDDIFLKLQETINSWAEEVTQTRSRLSGRLASFDLISRPVFKIVQPSAPFMTGLKAAPAKVRLPSAQDDAPPAAPPDESSLRRATESLQARILHLETQRSEMEKTHRGLEAELTFAREQLHEQIAAVTEAKTARADFERQAYEAAHALGRAEMEIAELGEQVRSKESRLLELSSESELLQGENALKSESIEAIEPVVEKLREEVKTRRRSEESAREELEQAQARVHELEDTIEQSTQAIDTLATEMNSLTAALGDSSRQLDAAADWLKALQQEVEERKASEEASHERLEQAEGHAQELEQSLAESTQTVDRLTAEVSSLNDALRDSSRHIDAADAGLEALQGEVAEHRGAEELARDQLEQAQARISELEGRLQASQQAVRRLTTEVDSLNTALGDTSEHLESALVELDQMQTERECRRLAVAELEKMVDAMRTREQLHADLVADAERRAVEAQSALHGEGDGAEVLRRELERLRAARDARQDELDAAAARLVSMQKAYDDLVASHKALRHEVQQLHQAQAERDRQPGSAVDLTPGPSSGAAEHMAQDVIDALTVQLKEKADAVDEAERVQASLRVSDQERRNTERALRAELQDLRERQSEGEYDRARLVQAFRQEIDSLREVAAEKDFVIHHAEGEVNALTRSEAKAMKSIQRMTEIGERLMAEAEGAAKDRLTLADEVTSLRARADEKEKALQALRGELRELRKRAQLLLDAGDTDPNHPVDRSSKAMEGVTSAAAESSIEDVSIDPIPGGPAQDEAAWKRSLRRLWGGVKDRAN